MSFPEGLKTRNKPLRGECRINAHREHRVLSRSNECPRSGLYEVERVFDLIQVRPSLHCDLQASMVTNEEPAFKTSPKKNYLPADRRWSYRQGAGCHGEAPV